MIKDRIHKLFELTVNHRAKDEWLKAMLEADRSGEEPWESIVSCTDYPRATQGAGCRSSTAQVVARSSAKSWRRNGKVTRTNTTTSPGFYGKVKNVTFAKAIGNGDAAL